MSGDEPLSQGAGERTGSERPGSEQTGSERTGSERTGSEQEDREASDRESDHGAQDDGAQDDGARGDSARGDDAELDASASADSTDEPSGREARAELLAAENRRLREEYGRAVRSQYRRTAVALAGVGVVGVLGAVLFPTVRGLLFALGGTGLFLGALTYYLAPERTIPASLGRAAYDAHARTGSDVVGDLGLRSERVYVPVSDRRARLFVPHNESYEVPDADLLSAAFVVGEDPATRGAAFDPTGGALYEEFERAAADGVGSDPADVAEQLAETLVDPFELVASADAEVDPAGGRVTVAVADSRFGAVDRFDHPVASFLGAGLALGLERPVVVDVERSSDDDRDALVTCTWDGADDEST